DDADEADWIARTVRGLLESDASRSPRDFVVLYRTNAQSRVLEEAFRHQGIAYRIVGGQRFYERREVKDILAYLRLIANFADDDAFLRVANVPRRGIGDTSLARLAETARRQGLSLLGAAKGAEENPEIRGAAATSLPELADLLERYGALADGGVAIDDLLRRLIDEIGYYEMLRGEGPEGEERIENVEELLRGAADLELRMREGDTDL